MLTLRGAAGFLLKDCRDEEVLLEGPAGTSKTIAACQKLVDACARHPGSQHLLCRATRKSLTDTTLVTFESVVGENHPEITRVSRENRHSYRLHGSEIVCAGLDEPSKAFGSAWGLVVLEEAIESNLNAWELFGRSARDPKLRRNGQAASMPYHQRIAVTNPGPPSHWLNRRATPFKKTAIESRADYKALYQFNSGPQSGRMRRLVTVHQDNPTLFDTVAWDWTPTGQKYLASLGGMSGARRDWMLLGLWSNAEGTVFADAFTDANIIEPFEIPSNWPVWVYADPGEHHPWAVGWFTISLTGKKILIAEIHKSKMGGVANVAKAIHETNARLKVEPIGYYLDPRHGFSSTAQSTATIAEQFAQFGLPHWGHAGRFQGKGVYASVEAVRWEFKTGTLLFFADCPGFIADHQSWSYKKDTHGEIPKGDDAYEDRNDDGPYVVRSFVSAKHTRDGVPNPEEVQLQQDEERLAEMMDQRPEGWRFNRE